MVGSRKGFGWWVVSASVVLAGYLAALQPEPDFESSGAATITPVRGLLVLWPAMILGLWLEHKKGKVRPFSQFLFAALLAGDTVYPIVWNVGAYNVLYFWTAVAIAFYSRERWWTPSLIVILTAVFIDVSLREGFRALVLLAVAFLPTVLVVRGAINKFLSEYERQMRLFDQSRWSASELSAVTLRLSRSIESARTQERHAERNRIAREIHDTTGHSLTALIVRIGILKQMLTAPRTHKEIASIESLASQSLRELRNEVSALRQEESRGTETIEWTHRLHQLSDVFSECTGIQINMNIKPGVLLPDATGEEIYHVCQESITNAYRHGRATLIDISMEIRNASRLVLRISDNGRGCGKLTLGNGLRGIEERIDMLHGEVAFQTKEGRGFDIGIVVPWPLHSRESGGGRNAGNNRRRSSGLS